LAKIKSPDKNLHPANPTTVYAKVVGGKDSADCADERRFSGWSAAGSSEMSLTFYGFRPMMVRAQVAKIGKGSILKLALMAVRSVH